MRAVEVREILDDAWRKAQVGDTDAFTYADLTRHLNEAWRFTYNSVIHAGDRCWVVSTLIESGDELPGDLYQIARVEHRGRLLYRSNTREEGTYWVEGERLYCSLKGHVSLFYFRAPGTLVFDPPEVTVPVTAANVDFVDDKLCWQRGAQLHLITGRVYTLPDSDPVEVHSGTRFTWVTDQVSHNIRCVDNSTAATVGEQVNGKRLVGLYDNDSVLVDNGSSLLEVWRAGTKQVATARGPLYGGRYEVIRNVFSTLLYDVHSGVITDVTHLFGLSPLVCDGFIVTGNTVRRFDDSLEVRDTYEVDHRCNVLRAKDCKSGYGLLVTDGAQTRLIGQYGPTVVRMPSRVHSSLVSTQLAVLLCQVLGLDTSRLAAMLQQEYDDFSSTLEVDTWKPKRITDARRRVS